LALGFVAGAGVTATETFIKSNKTKQTRKMNGLAYLLEAKKIIQPSERKSWFNRFQKI
jgi:hypothetical protein